MNSRYKFKLIRCFLFIFSIVLLWIQSGCKKMIGVDLPIDKITGPTVYNTKATAVAAMTGIYAKMRNGQLISGGVTNLTSEMSDELALPFDADPFYTNDVSVNDDFIWMDAYRTYLYQVNSVIEGVSSGNIPAGEKKILLGEAKFVRAYIYFYLVNYFGDVPLVLTTDLKTNANISRSTKADVYARIVSDLSEAQADLSPDFLSTDLSTVTTERVRPNKAAATALLARVYLYNQQWQKAEEEASEVINDSRYQLLPDLNGVFLKNSPEAIWQMQPQFVDDGNSNTPDGRTLIPYPGDVPQRVISSFLLNTFEANDLRRADWTTTVSSGGADYPISFKYKIGNTTGGTQDQQEYIMVLRLAEQYLIRAEARAQQGKLLGADGAASDLNAIRNRAGLPNTAAAAQGDLLDAISRERRVELFIEGAHRWFDLKRTGKIDAVMGVVTPLKGGTWSPYKALLPIPAQEFKNNPALRGHQNPGYSEN